MRLDESMTKDKIIMLLKKSGGMTAEKLSKQIGITPMGVRQHLLSLERKAMVEYESRKHGIGRPVFIYRLTQKADDMFPKAYHELAMDILGDIEALDGRQKVDQLFRMRKAKLFKERNIHMPDLPDISGRVKALAGLLEKEGYVAELAENGKNFLLSEYNCPLSRVAVQYPEACQYDLELMNDLLGGNVSRTACMASGDPSCTFVIPKA
jgi:predicted ArsR family transcriptional regulator